MLRSSYKMLPQGSQNFREEKKGFPSSQWNLVSGELEPESIGSSKQASFSTLAGRGRPSSGNCIFRWQTCTGLTGKSEVEDFDPTLVIETDVGRFQITSDW